MRLNLPLLPRFAVRLARRHFLWHLLVPLLGGAAGEAAIAALVAHARGESFSGLRAYFFSFERAGLLAGVFLTFSLVLYFFVQREADIGMRNVGLAVLQDALKGARRYFATSAIPLREWFEPPTQIYFSTLVAHRIATPTFWHDRVLFVFTSSDTLNLGSSLMDEYHARAFIKLHRLSDGRLAYLERNDIFRILALLSVRDRKALGSYRRWQALLPEVVLKYVPLSVLRRRIRGLAAALIEYDDGRPPCVVTFSKSRHDVGIRRLRPDESDPFLKFFGYVKRAVFEPAEGDARPAIKAEHDFMSYYT